MFTAITTTADEGFLQASRLRYAIHDCVDQFMDKLTSVKIIYHVDS